MNTVIKEIEDLPQANTNQSLQKLVNILKEMQGLDIILEFMNVLLKRCWESALLMIPMKVTLL